MVAADSGAVRLGVAGPWLLGRARLASAVDEFDETPLAGASLGQVHRAVYKGTPVAVKIQRAGLTEMFDTDFRNIRLGCRVMNAMERGYEKIRRLQGESKTAADRDWMTYANDAARLLYEEIDYINEENAETAAIARRHRRQRRRAGLQ